jgi:FlaA1/EpsC-like NDP-sugar epimerase
MRSLLIRHRLWALLALHFGIISSALIAAFFLRFEFRIPADIPPLMYGGLAIALPVKTMMFWSHGLFRGWTRHDGFLEACEVVLANLLASFIFLLGCFALMGTAFPRSIYVLDALLCVVMTMCARFMLRLVVEVATLNAQRKKRKRVLVYGAGAGGALLARENRANPSLGVQIVGFVDDDPAKHNTVLAGAPVLGAGRDIQAICDRSAAGIDEIVIAMPSANGSQMRRAVEYCRCSGIPMKTLPGVAEMISSPKALGDGIRSIEISDLLGRAPVRLEEGAIRKAVEGKSVLVTGAAGSIGSELCRQIAAYRPSILVCFDHAESDLYRLDLELRRRFPKLEVRPVIGDIRNRARVEEAIKDNGVESIYHAAAYKHVPMMETQPVEVITTNVLGTWNLVNAARRHHVESFLMISSDKAVNPTNVMGLTKRIAELVVGAQENDPSNRTKFVSVRFGNVLGSNGSVVPLFKEQIARGGPVTVTDPEITRYFMTIREAVQLVLQASVLGQRSEVFVLDMGEPVKIVDLANNMIRLAGLEPGKDVEIEFVGLRPGEKLYEELIIDGENIMPTAHEKIKVFRGATFRPEQIEAWIGALEDLIEHRDPRAMVMHLAELAPEYKPGKLWSPVETGAGGRLMVATRESYATN